MIVKEPKYYWEDFEVGEVHQLGEKRVDKDEIIAFAKQFDPQPFHVDEAAAQASMYGGLIASGWHTAALMMRLVVDHYLSHVASLASPGIDELRWHKPVRPGDTLSVRITVSEATRSRSKPDRGIIRSNIEVFNQHADLVMSLKAINFLKTKMKDEG